jgi:hypothetical protein
LNSEKLILSLLKNNFKKDSKISELHIINSILEILVNTLKSNFPLLLDKSTSAMVNISKEKEIILNNVLECFHSLMDKFPLTNMMNISNVTFVLVKLIEYLKSQEAMKVAIQLFSTSLGSENSIHMLDNVILHLLNRMNS